MSFESFMKKHPAAGAAGALAKILALICAFWLCVANTGAPCMEISEPKATGPIGIKISRKDMSAMAGSSVVFNLSAPVASFVLKQGPDLLFEAVCREGAGNCIPKKIRVDCTLMTDAASGSPLAIVEAPAAAPAAADASGEPDAADMAAVKGGEKKIVMNEAASKRCTEGGFFSSGKETVAVAKTSEGKGGTLHFQARMISAPGYLGCNDDYKKCGESYK